MTRFDSEAIASALRDRALALARELLPNGHLDGNDWVCGDVFGAAPRNRGSLRVVVSGDKAGSWWEHAAGIGGGPLGLIAENKRISIPAAERWAADWIRLPEIEAAPITTPARPPLRRDPEKEITAARRIVSDAGPITRDSPAARYLSEVRALDLDAIADPLRGLRFASKLGYWIPDPKDPERPIKVAELPAIVAPIVSPERRVIACQRVYLEPDGSSKAKLVHPTSGKPLDARKTIGAARGGACRLGPLHDHIAVCEGIEDGLTVAQAVPGLSVWASCGTAFLAALQLPPSVSRVTIAADADAAGELAAANLAERLTTEGRVVSIARPPAGFKDFNAALIAGRDIQ